MSSSHVPRRSFLGRLAAGTAAFGAAFGGAAAFPSLASAEPVADEMDNWFGSMKGTYKTIYDCAGMNAAPDGVMFARNLMHFSAEKLGTKDADNSIVVCFRHFATPYGYTDAMWEKYPIAKALGINDPKTKQPATRNWLLHDLIEDTPGINIPGIRARGAQFAVCGAATEYFAEKILAAGGGDAKAIFADIAANLIPGARMAPAGVVAVQRAQKAGFAYTFAG
jgi:hypothetical protein